MWEIFINTIVVCCGVLSFLIALPLAGLVIAGVITLIACSVKYLFAKGK